MANKWWPRYSEEDIGSVGNVLRSGRVNSVGGGEVKEFEREWCAKFGIGNAVAVSSGTAALEGAVRALRMETGSSVIVPARGFPAVASAVAGGGMCVKFADIDAATMNVGVRELEAARDKNTAAVIVIHYAGLPCPMAEIMEWAWTRNIRMIEDCSHAHGAWGDGKPVGSWGDVGCFSFCENKILSTGGEGGMVVTDKPWIATRVREWRDHGRVADDGAPGVAYKWRMRSLGTNARMTEMQGALGRCGLRKLDDWNARRREMAAMYAGGLSGCDLELPPDTAGRVYYEYVVGMRRSDREKVLRALLDAGIPASVGGCPDMSMEAVFEGAAMPVAAGVGASSLALPCYPTMTDDDVRGVVDIVTGAML